MKCPKCNKTIPDNSSLCPFCQERFVAERRASQDTGRFSAIDPSKDSYDFDLQYTLTFKDSGEIRQAIADMDLGLGKERSGDFLKKSRNPEPTEKRPERRQRSITEMEEAAQRAALRRERRNQGKKTILSRSSGTEGMSRSDREKAAALRRARARHTRSDQQVKKNRRFIFGTCVAVLVVALIIGTINLFAGMMNGDVVYPTIYTKSNQLYLVYDKKPQQISTNLIYAPVSLENADAVSSSSKSKLEDPKVYKAETPTEKQLVNVSDDGLYTYFMENMDMNSGLGDLIYYKNDSRRSRTLVSISVYYKKVFSQDGQSVLFLRNTDENGNHGELCYWRPSMKEPISVAQDICAGNFVFSQNAQKALYIKNFNPTVNTGDLCIRDFGKDASSESKMVDEKVAFVFGTTPKSDTYFYAKDYDTKTGTYNLYSSKNGESPILRAEKAFLAPILLTKSEALYAYSNYSNNYQTISYIDLETGNIGVMEEQITQIVKLRNDEKAIIYTRTYAETGKTDYYLLAAGENAPQKVANAVVNPKDSSPDKAQFDVSADFSRVAYISGYDEENGRGVLMTMSIVNGYVGTEKRISDEAYGCDVSADGAVVRYASNYNMHSNTVSLASYANSNTTILAEEVCIGAFTYDAAGEIMVFATEVQSTPVNTGNIKTVTTKGKIRNIENGVNSYGLKKDGNILLLKRESAGENPSGKLYFSNAKGNKIKLMDDGVSSVLFY